MKRGMGHHPPPRRGQIKAQIFRSLFRSLVALVALAHGAISSQDADASVQEALAVLSCSTEAVSSLPGRDAKMIGIS